MILSHLIGGLLQYSFMDVRVEGVAYFTEALHALLAEQLFEMCIRDSRETARCSGATLFF